MRELNWKPGQSATLGVLGDESTGSGADTVTILELSGKRVRLAADLKLRGGTPVRVEWDTQLLLGHVLTAEPGGFWMDIQHILDTGELDWQRNGWQPG
jgi:hypothetical protein